MAETMINASPSTGDQHQLQSRLQLMHRRGDLGETLGRALREQLLDRYDGEYVAIHQGRVVDHDTDKLKLGLRVYQRFGGLHPSRRAIEDHSEPPGRTDRLRQAGDLYAGF